MTDKATEGKAERELLTVEERVYIARCSEDNGPFLDARDARSLAPLARRLLADLDAKDAEIARLRAAIDEAITSAVDHDHHRYRGTDERKEFYAILCTALGHNPELYEGTEDEEDDDDRLSTRGDREADGIQGVRAALLPSDDVHDPNAG